MDREAKPIILLLAVAFILYSGILSAEGATMATIAITSPAFENGDFIPSKFTCDGEDINPPLFFSNIPPEAKSLALIVDDPDAPGGMWVHWVVWNIDPKTTEIGLNKVPDGAKLGMNDFRKTSYGGPCPPSGTHRYFFKLYALDAKLELGTNVTKTALERTMKGHVIAQGELMGQYKRR